MHTAAKKAGYSSIMLILSLGIEKKRDTRKHTVFGLLDENSYTTRLQDNESDRLESGFSTLYSILHRNNCITRYSQNTDLSGVEKCLF